MAARVLLIEDNRPSLELMSYLLQAFGHTPLEASNGADGLEVAVTALAMVGDRDRAMRAGFDGYLSKPIEPETFVQEIERFLADPSHPTE